MNHTTREALASPTTLSQGTPRRTRQMLGLSTSWALVLDLPRRFDCQATTSMIPPPGAPPPCIRSHLHSALLQDYDCTEQPAADLPALQSDAGGIAAANTGPPPPPSPPARSQDTYSDTLVLPQLNLLHEACVCLCACLFVCVRACLR
jgi:hypothetical protein